MKVKLLENDGIWFIIPTVGLDVIGSYFKYKKAIFIGFLNWHLEISF